MFAAVGAVQSDWMLIDTALMWQYLPLPQLELLATTLGLH